MLLLDSLKTASITSSIQAVDAGFFTRTGCISKGVRCTQLQSASPFLQGRQNYKGSVGLLKCVRYLFEKSFSVGNLRDTEQLISQAEQQGNRT